VSRSQPSPGVTVTERIKALGYESNKVLAWRVGAAIRNKWEALTGALPEKGLRPKTSGMGSHCMAVYPPKWGADIDATIEKIAAQINAEEARQLPLWGKK